ncbi:MAG: glycoside hydrolase family 3 C-terminal domain-containing protein [Rhizomicrobium sp.]|jgi:beta-glucosidase
MNGKVAYAAVFSLFAAFPMAALAQPPVLPLPRPALPGEPQPAATAPALPPPLPSGPPPWSDKSLSGDARADLVQAQMTREEELTLVRGYFGVDYPWTAKVYPEAIRKALPGSAGYVPGIPRLGIPALTESDASLGVANGRHMRPGDQAVALPSSLLTAATWNGGLAYAGGAMFGAEAHHKGFNVMLAGGVDLAREPRGGRTFEYAGEDPLLAGIMAGEAIRGTQDLHIISTIKHFALNDQETGRMTMSANISDAAMRESDLLAFEIAIERGDPGAVMCSYNRINTVYACENDYLLNTVLKGDWGYKGFVLSDWGAVHSTVDAANNGLDQESAYSYDKEDYFGEALSQAVAAGTVPETRLHDMVHRILRTTFAKGLFDYPPVKKPIAVKTDLAVAQSVAEEGIVLLKNAQDLLPISLLKRPSRRITIIGGYADLGVLSGSGSSQVIPIGNTPSLEVLAGGAVWMGPDQTPQIPAGTIVLDPPSPYAAIREQAPWARVVFYDGGDVAKAAALARISDIVIVFAQQWTSEGWDVPDLSLPGNQDELINAVADANSRTIVVLQTGGPVLMPWLNKVGAVLEAWYPGNRGANAIARILFGAVNPSGRLPITFPQSENQLPRPVIPGHEQAYSRIPLEGTRSPFDIDYVEGANVGYKWFKAKKLTPLFPFGYGLSYTSFEFGGLRVAGGQTLSVSFDMRNTGKHPGKATAQVYATLPGGVARLIGWSKLDLKPGETRRVTLTADPRLLATFDSEAHLWRVAAGDYAVTLGSSSAEFSANATVHIAASAIKP